MPEFSQTGLRRRLRSLRRAVGAPERRAAASAVDAALVRMGLPRPGSRIAGYQAMDGELDPAAIMRRALTLGCKVHVPVITSLRHRRMRFRAWPQGRAQAQDAGAPVRFFDLVLVPLVGFDDEGNRLGMGAGFYDRHFAFLRHRDSWHRPLLLGLAFEVQRLQGIAAKPLDVPLWGIVTEHAVHGRASARIRRNRLENGS